ncbi:MAG: AsmA family protein [Desulfobacteraceae bacterium]
MGKTGKILLAVVGVLGAAVIGLSLFISFFLTEERLKAIIIPKAEESLGRSVAMEGIKASLFSGITIDNVAVKEKDKTGDFVTVKKFVLSYKLMPLLNKKVVVSEIRVVEPKISVVRDKKGRFNYESLAVLDSSKKPVPEKSEPDQKEKAAALPLALTVDKITVSKAELTFTDQLGELPDIKGSGDLNLGLAMGTDFASLSYKGDLDFLVDAVYRDLASSIKGKTQFDQHKVAFGMDAAIDSETARVEGSVKNYTKAPDIQLDISSEKLDIDHLMALLAGLGSPASKEKSRSGTTKSKPATPIARDLPEGLKAAGSISVAEARYNELPVRDFLVQYSLDQGIFKVKEFSANMADGQVASDLEMDLNLPAPAYKGRVTVKDLQVISAVAGIMEKKFDQISGAFNSDFTYSGQGFDPEAIKKSLTLSGEYGLFNGEIKNNPITDALALLFKLDALKKISFDKMDGNVKIEDGIALLNTKMNGSRVSGSARGKVGLDGSLDLPLVLRFSPELSERLTSKLSFARHLVDEKGQAELKLKLLGTVDRPKPMLDLGESQKKLVETLTDKAAKEIQRALSKEPGEKSSTSKPQEQAKELLKGLFQ